MHVSVYHMLWVPQRPEEGIEFLELELQMVISLLEIHWEPNLGSLAEQQVFLTLDPALQLLHLTPHLQPHSFHHCQPAPTPLFEQVFIVD